MVNPLWLIDSLGAWLQSTTEAVLARPWWRCRTLQEGSDREVLPNAPLQCLCRTPAGFVTGQGLGAWGAPPHGHSGQEVPTPEGGPLTKGWPPRWPPLPSPTLGRSVSPAQRASLCLSWTSSFTINNCRGLLSDYLTKGGLYKYKGSNPTRSSEDVPGTPNPTIMETL